MLSVFQLKLSFGGRVLFSNVTFQLQPGLRYGLVGANGSGKSTLMKILAGEVEAEEGQIVITGGSKIGTLKQEHFLYEGWRVIDVVLAGLPFLIEARKKRLALLDLKEFTEEDCLLLEKLDVEYERIGGYSAESKAAKLLIGLGISENDHEKSLSFLSGGYKLRVLLAQCLFSEPDVLILDEPTNHLDILSIQWLEGYLKAYPHVVLVTSHDRHFLNAVCTNILDLDHEQVTHYPGNYDAFLERKQNDLMQKEALLEKQDKRREELQGFITRFKAKASKARQAHSKLHLVKKIETEMEDLKLNPTSRRPLNLRFNETLKSASLVLKVLGIQKSFGEKCVLNKVSFEIVRQERVAFIGVNGIGKSTLLNILAGRLPQDGGEIVWGASCHPLFFPQDHSSEVFGDLTVLEWLTHKVPTASDNALREILAKVLFSRDDVKKPVAVLSGGEKARLILGKMMLLPHNVLIFDEPTNHLDMEGIDSLIEALKGYNGTLIMVSHNRHFIDEIATRIVEITKDKGVIDYPGTYKEYRQQVELAQVQKKKEGVSQEKKERLETRDEKKAHQKRVSQLEKECQRLEEALSHLENLLVAPQFYEKTPQAEINQLLKKKKELEDKLRLSFEEWAELV